MSRVRVTLTPARPAADQLSIVTGSDGKFSFYVSIGIFSIVSECR